jgi:acetamidase/formamidase
MTTREITPSTETLHGRFALDIPPVLTIESGDAVRYQTLDSGWGLIEQADPFARPVKFERRDPQLDRGHALCGPIAIAGAEPGMTLEVRINAVRPGRWGWSGGGGYPSPLNARLGVGDPPECVMRWRLAPDEAIATNQHGRRLRTRPFMGILGMPADVEGPQSTYPPRASGGNIDCRELVPGSRLFLPIAVRGGLFSTGDGHAVQGDGEVAGPALECPMERVELEFHLHSDARLNMPRAHTPAGWVTFGFDTTLDEAAALALDGMLNLMGELLGVDRREALALASLAVDLRITQMVNGVRGVHAVLPHAVLDQLRGTPSALA